MACFYMRWRDYCWIMSSLSCYRNYDYSCMVDGYSATVPLRFKPDYECDIKDNVRDMSLSCAIVDYGLLYSSWFKIFSKVVISRESS